MRTTMKKAFMLVLLAVFGLAGTGCDGLLDVRTPDTIAANTVNPLEDAAAFSNSAWQNYQESLGDHAMYTAWFTNEMRVGDTFPTRNEFGRRFIDDRNGDLNTAWGSVSSAVASAEDALVLLAELGDADINITRLYLTTAFASLNMAEAFCTGVIREGPDAPSPELTRAEMLAHAIERFEQAIASAAAVGSDADDFADAARVGLARANLYAGNNAAAATAAASVDDAFVYNAEYIDDPGNRGRLGNTVWSYSGATATRESGVVGPEWRALGQGDDNSDDAPFAGEEAGDARVMWEYDGRTAQDGVHEYVFQRTMDGWDAPIPVATGLEARYIELQAAGTDPERLAFVNDRRAVGGQGIFAGTGDALLEELLHQKGRDFWMTGRRMADWRWYTGDGATARSTDFSFIIEPSDPYYKPEVGTMGDQVCFPLPYNEYSRNSDIER